MTDEQQTRIKAHLQDFTTGIRARMDEIDALKQRDDAWADQYRRYFWPVMGLYVFFAALSVTLLALHHPWGAPLWVATVGTYLLYSGWHVARSMGKHRRFVRKCREAEDYIEAHRQAFQRLINE